jgi:hypothetical protein
MMDQKAFSPENTLGNVENIRKSSCNSYLRTECEKTFFADERII